MTPMTPTTPPRRTTPNERWQWLFQPLLPHARRRLEICLGVVVTGACVVGLSTVVQPDPSKLSTPVVVVAAPSADRREADLRAEPPPAPKVSPHFAKAVALGDLDAMEKLHTPGMPLDGMLALASESGAKAVTVWLLDHGADVHEDEDSVDAPVLLADEHPEVVAALIDRGTKEPSLTTAAQAGAPNAVTRLLAAHAAVNPTESTPLAAALSSTRATSEKKALIVGKLLVAGANPNHDDTESPMTMAVRSCEAQAEGDELVVRVDVQETRAAECVTLIKLLAKHGARTKGDAIGAAVTLHESGHGAVLDAVLAAPLERGATATALASAFSVQTPVVKRLVAKGVDWSWHDGEEDAALPLLSAVQRGDRDYARVLLDAGAPAGTHYKDGTCALGAAIDGATNAGSDYARIVELLIARGADVNRRLPDGRTPLFAAAESGDLRVVTALLDRGARVNDLVLDDAALDAAEQNGHQPIARVLHARGARRARKTPSEL